MYAGQALETAPIEAFFQSPGAALHAAVARQPAVGRCAVARHSGRRPQSGVGAAWAAGSIRGVRRPRRSAGPTRPPLSEPGPGHWVRCHHRTVGRDGKRSWNCTICTRIFRFIMRGAGATAGCARWMVCRCRSRAVKCSAIVGESGCGKINDRQDDRRHSSRPPPDISCSKGMTSARCRRVEGRAFRKGLQYCYQDPGASLGSALAHRPLAE